jgi:imidazolonepropionase
MIRADLLVTGIGELATLSVGPVPRTGPAMRDLGMRSNAALAVADGRFVYVGSDRAARREVRVRSRGIRWDARGGVVLPGFVDAHTHLLFAGERSQEVALKLAGASYTEIAARGGGMFDTVRTTQRATTTRLLSESAQRLNELARSGVTTAEVKSGYALDHAGELRLLSLVPRLEKRCGVSLVPTFLGAHAVPEEYAGRADVYVDEMVSRTLPAVASGRLAKFCDVFCEPGFFSVEQSRRILSAARSVGLGLKIHADEFVAIGGARLAAELPVHSAEHLLETAPEDRERLARAGVCAVLLPVTPFASMSPHRSPGREMVDAGVPVALGSDLSPNSWVCGMPVVLAHAVYSARLTPEEAITAATVNAAHAIGRADQAGTIAPGRPADFLVYDLSSPAQIPYRIGAAPRVVFRQGIAPPPAGLRP